MKYEEAALDANFAMHVQPQRIEAYQALAEFFIALNNYPEALKLLEILHFRNPSDAIIKSQYEQIRDIERKRQNKSAAKQLTQMMKWQENKAKSAKMFEEARKYLEDRDQREVNEEAKKRQSRRGQGIIDDMLVVLSDELNEDSEGDANNERMQMEKPGNAQFLETPRVQQQIDFRLVTQDQIFGKKKEVFRMKLDKLSVVDCQLC